MKAAFLLGKEQVEIREIQPPPLNQGEVRVRIEAALTCGTDLKVYRRGYHAKMIVPPAVFGHEFAGIVDEVASGAEGWSVGEQVVVANSAPCGACFYCRSGQENLCDDLLFLNGAYAESIVVPPRFVRKNMLRLKAGTQFRDAALVEPLACVVQGVEDTGLREGERVLVLGAGPIGLMFATLGERERMCGHRGGERRAKTFAGPAFGSARGHRCIAAHVIARRAPGRRDFRCGYRSRWKAGGLGSGCSSGAKRRQGELLRRMPFRHEGLAGYKAHPLFEPHPAGEFSSHTARHQERTRGH